MDEDKGGLHFDLFYYLDVFLWVDFTAVDNVGFEYYALEWFCPRLPNIFICGSLFTVCWTVFLVDNYRSATTVSFTLISL